jgi:ABC-type branched-subunit amino acid transport system substrate-binding protein
MRFGKKLFIVLLAFGLVAAACGDDDDVTPTQAPPAATDAPDAPPAATDAPDAPPAATDAPPAPVATDAPPPAATIATDIGVTDDEIVIGLLSDLSGPFAGLVGLIVAGQQAFWASVNAQGGIAGRQVKLEIVDTGYDVQAHVQLYGELKDKVVMFAHSTGSPQTIAINEDLKDDMIAAVPLTWYSGWTDPVIGTNLPHHATPYCIEAHNVLGYIYDEWVATRGSAPTTIAVAGEPGDYGGDSVAGVLLAAETLGLTVTYNGDQQIARGQDNPSIIQGVTDSGADIVWLTTNFDDFTEVFSGALAGGFRDDAVWSGSAPSFSPAMLGSEVAVQLAGAVTFGFFNAGWGADVPGFAEMEAALLAVNPELPVTDFLSEGWVEAMITKAILDKAAADGDMTQAGVLAAMQSLDTIDLQGLAPNPVYSGTANENVSRETYILKLDLAGFAAQGGRLNIGAAADLDSASSGFLYVENLYTHPIARDFVFEGACWTAG